MLTNALSQLARTQTSRVFSSQLVQICLGGVNYLLIKNHLRGFPNHLVPTVPGSKIVNFNLTLYWNMTMKRCFSI